MHFVESCTFFRSVSPPTAQSVTIAGDKDNIFVEEDRVHTLSDAQSVNVSRCVPSGQLNRWHYQQCTAVLSNVISLRIQLPNLWFANSATV